MNGAQEVLTGGALSPFNISRPAPARTREESAAQREITLGEQERVSRGKSEAQKKAERFGREKGRKLEEAEAAKNIDLLRIEGERPLPVAMPEFQSPRKTGEELIALMLVSAVGSSAIGKKNYLAAATAMSGALKGYEAGKKTEYEQALKEFDIASKKAMQEDKINTARYLQIANSKKLTVMEKFNTIKMEALRIGDQQAAALAEVKDWDRLASNINQRLNQIDAREKEIIRHEERLEDIRNRRSEAAATREAGRRPEYFRDEKTGKLYAVTGTTVQEVQMPEGVAGLTPLRGRAGAAAAPSAAVTDERGMFTIDPKQLPKGKTSDEFNAREPILGAISDLNYLINKKDEKGVANKDKMGYVFQALSLNPTLNLPVLTTYYKNDPDMLAIIRRLGQFESQEFQIGGKALTVNERNVLQPIYGWRGTNVNALLGQTELALQELDEKQKVITSQYSEAKKARRNMQINLGRGRSKDNPIILDSEDDAGGLPAGTFVRVDKSIFKVREE